MDVPLDVPLESRIKLKGWKMTIGKKLLSGFLSIILLICVVGYFAVHVSQQALQRSIAENSVILASEILDKIDRNIYDKIIRFRAYSKNLTLQNFVLASNREFEKLDNIQKHINDKDREWTSVQKTVTSPSMQQLINNRLSEELRRKIGFYEEQYGYKVFGELFVTNKYGANIAQTGKTSDYRQDDEQWWQNAKKDGLYVSDVKYDESAAIYSIDIGIRIDDENGNFSGVMKLVLNIEDVIAILTKLETIHIHKTAEFKLINKDGEIIYSTEEYDISSDLPAEMNSPLKHEESHLSYFIAEGDKPGEGKELFCYAYSKGYRDYKGFGWILIVEHETKEIFVPIIKLRNGIIITSLAVIILAILIGFIISRSISRPVTKIRAATIEIGRGNLDAKIEISSKDEIGMLANTFNKMTEDLQNTTASKNYFDNIIQSMMDMLFVLNPDKTIRTVNSAVQNILGYPENDLIGKDFSILEGEGEGEPISILVQEGFIGQAEKTLLAKDGKEIPVLLSGSVMRAGNGEIEAVVCVARDITERKRIEKENASLLEETKNSLDDLKQTQSYLLQSEKMASVGQLAAGVAHEINNPTGFVHSNLGSMKKYSARVLELINRYEEGLAVIKDNGSKEVTSFYEEMDELKKKLKIDFILKDFEKVITDSLEGTQRIKKIVADLKSFSRVDQAEFKRANINEGLTSTLNVVWNELKYKCTVEKNYGDLPQIYCNPGQLNQVFMNLLLNAAQALEQKGTIAISTHYVNGQTGAEQDYVEIKISDTGRGIPEDKLKRIFEPFFTTKPVGKGTGLGLSISYDIIQKHKGEISVESAVGKGTTFAIKLPVVNNP